MKEISKQKLKAQIIKSLKELFSKDHTPTEEETVSAIRKAFPQPTLYTAGFGDGKDPKGIFCGPTTNLDALLGIHLEGKQNNAFIFKIESGKEPKAIARWKEDRWQKRKNND